jgi:hypothetical protein
VLHRAPYSCDSWRCETCRRHEAAVLFARLKQAREPLPPDGWVYLVLTLDREGYSSGRPWTDVNHAYAQLGTLNRAVLERIGRRWGDEVTVDRKLPAKPARTVTYTRNGKTITRTLKAKPARIATRTYRSVGNRWVSVVEAHRSGWPHLNLMVWCPELAEHLRQDRDERLEDPELADAVALARDAWRKKEPIPASIRERARRVMTVEGELRELVTAAGWGYQSTAEAARDVDAVISYSVKLCGLHDAAIGEVAKLTQLPLNAPERFRRYRCGKGFLPERYKNADYTGCLLRRRRTLGAWEILPVNPPKDPAQQPMIDRAIAAEVQVIDEENRERSRTKLPPRPLRRVMRGMVHPWEVVPERSKDAAAEAAKLEAWASRDRVEVPLPAGVLGPVQLVVRVRVMARTG